MKTMRMYVDIVHWFRCVVSVQMRGETGLVGHVQPQIPAALETPGEKRERRTYIRVVQETHIYIYCYVILLHYFKMFVAW